MLEKAMHERMIICNILYSTFSDSWLEKIVRVLQAKLYFWKITLKSTSLMKFLVLRCISELQKRLL